MIWLFKVNDVYWSNKIKINDYFTFCTNDINFDITKYDVSLYFGTAEYYLLDVSNNKLIYKLECYGKNRNPIRSLVPVKSEIYNIIRIFYLNTLRINKLKTII